MLNAMRQIKLAAEELRFRDRILALREVEVRMRCSMLTYADVC
jgi:hypothetical protein